MKIARLILTFICTVVPAATQAMTFDQWQAGAPNPNGAASTGGVIYTSVGQVKGELFLVDAYWACPALTATITDNGGNTYHPIGSKVISGRVAFQHWYAVNRVEESNYAAIKITLNGSCTAKGNALNSFYIDLISVKGIDANMPIDAATVVTGTGTTAAMRLTSGKPAERETMLAVFLTAGVGVPFTPTSGWTPWGAGEAVAGNEYKAGVMAPTTATVTAASASPWGGILYGIRPGTSGMGALVGGGGASPNTGPAQAAVVSRGD
jgi:hypothetical protein